jgi:hypothetical protein
VQKRKSRTPLPRDCRGWLDKAERPIQWIHGGSELGKTVPSEDLSTELISHQHISFDQKYPGAYFFFDDKDNRLMAQDALLANVLAQLLRHDRNTLIHFYNGPVYKIDKEKTVWTFEMLWDVFDSIVADEKLEPIFVIIDAVSMLWGHCASFCGCPVQNSANCFR